MRELGKQYNEGDIICILGRISKTNYGRKKFDDIRLYDESKSLVENLCSPVLSDHLYLLPSNLSDFTSFKHFGQDLVILGGTVSRYFRLSKNMVDAGLEDCRIFKMYAWNPTAKCFMVLEYNNENEVYVKECYANEKFFRQVFNPWNNYYYEVHGYVNTKYGRTGF